MRISDWSSDVCLPISSSAKRMKEMTRREFAKGAAGAAAGILAPAAVAAAGKAAAQTRELHWATATELRERIARKDVSVTEVVQHLLGPADAQHGAHHVYATLHLDSSLGPARAAV